ncbi:TIGR04255 family protein [Dyadobacter sp. CY261]|uniref:TIGR04255 family protein n=1 Tax=Dyadobacter sp. CY261 TaxID=2907203 RepID=UPI001F389185|nr:TIGR04255 family protein [Dyadobacter sp. CY261]MCF0071810.1 TIGR04255 family protein [Dyadobacter sp. CY261]
MKIPRKIDDRLKDAIIQLRFEKVGEVEQVSATFAEQMGTDFQEIEVPEAAEISAGNKEFIKVYIHKEGKYRLVLTDKAISFNIVNGYVGWYQYSAFIKKTIRCLLDEGHYSELSTLGVRYISIFDETPIFNNITPVISFSPLSQEAKNAQFTIELDRSPHKVVVTLLNSITRQIDGSNNVMFSVVDIDTSSPFRSSLFSVDAVMLKLNECHNEQKEVFFSLLKEDFIKSLNPVY